MDSEINSWRTIHGICRDTNLSLEIIESYIFGNKHLFIKSIIRPSGIFLYGLKSKHKDYTHDMEL